VRRLPAEVAYDAIMFATAGSDQLQKMHQDTTGRAIADLRSNRRDGRAQNVPRALRIFGQPDRATACDCERSTEPSLSQSLYLLNDDELFGRLNRSDGRVAELTRTVSETARQRQRDRDAANNKEQRIQEVERRIEQLRQNGREEDAANLERRLASIRRGAIKEDGTANQVAQQQGTSLDTDELVREMYLRTLSRMPTDQEMSRNREFLTTARDPVSGIRDVLWALMNTKEFIVNH
jgi:flagellar biosynthesis GTPase FlhF